MEKQEYGCKTTSSHSEKTWALTTIPVLRYLGTKLLLCSAFPHLWQHTEACISSTSFLWDILTPSTGLELGPVLTDFFVVFHLFLTIMSKGLDTF